ncbi:MAG: hypothetical protein A3I02_16700 [Betaproteobacteria bacterium RIFCSPLOWO2_02_FULL_67_26]|nr:MAG: hypothetical protein A3I02_16700 [Betaproteobacteria bacterium RIFCSPLOWO2_02_FULL_67_26]
MKPMDSPARGGISPEQLLYARILDYGMKAGLAVLIAGFAAYLGGALPVQLPFEELPRLWALPVGDYLRDSGMPMGWGWLAMLDRGDVLALTGIVLLAGVSVPCLVVLAFAYAGRGDWAYFGIALALIGVLVLAASGVFGSH